MATNKRVCRDDEPPWLGYRGYVLDGRFPHEARLPSGLTFRYRLGRWHRIGWRAPIKRRRLAGHLKANGRRVGAVQLTQYEPQLMTNCEFVSFMDEESQHDYDLAIMLCRHWEDLSDVTAYGDIVEIDLVWMKRRFARRGEWADAVHLLLAEIETDYALIILKAFPLEHEVRRRGRAVTRLMRRRQAAMLRHYGWLLGVRPFPGRYGKEGWMWCFNPLKAAFLDPPERRRSPAL